MTKEKLKKIIKKLKKENKRLKRELKDMTPSLIWNDNDWKDPDESWCDSPQNPINRSW